MHLELDVVELNRGIFGAKRTLKAYRTTFNQGGIGEVLVSKRKKRATDEEDPVGIYPRGKKGEKRKNLHGKAIANILRKKGIDPFDYTDGEISKTNEWMNRQFIEMIERIEATSKPQVEQIRMIITWAASSYERLSRDKVKDRKLPPNKPKYLAKKILASSVPGFVMKQYGTPPPTGILTGRWLRGFRHRWRAGPQGRESSGGNTWGIGALLG